ncbi:MAG TPA: type II CAAX endopeptidase family protein [Patescibacteria group bacterium]|nr:type II CAAX endopeptidase family protein [Patescibacteria group bacterium]
MSDRPQSAPSVTPPSNRPGLEIGPLWLAAGFGVFLFLGWMILVGLWRPRLDWFSAAGFHVAAVLYYGVLDAFALALSAAFLCGLEGHPFRALGLSFSPGWVVQSATGVAWGAGVISLTSLLLVVTHAAALSPLALRSVLRVVFFALFFLLSSTFEELAFRGYALQRAADSIGPVAAALFSSLLFGWAHMANPQATLLSSLNTTLAGLLLATARLRSRGLWMPIGLHFAWNFFLGPVFAFPVSGYTFGAKEISVFSPPLAWLSGGAYGPEGGAALTAVVAVGLLLLVRIPIPFSSIRTASDVDYRRKTG